MRNRSIQWWRSFERQSTWELRGNLEETWCVSYHVKGNGVLRALMLVAEGCIVTTIIQMTLELMNETTRDELFLIRVIKVSCGCLEFREAWSGKGDI